MEGYILAVVFGSDSTRNAVNYTRPSSPRAITRITCTINPKYHRNPYSYLGGFPSGSSSASGFPSASDSASGFGSSSGGLSGFGSGVSASDSTSGFSSSSGGLSGFGSGVSASGSAELASGTVILWS